MDIDYDKVLAFATQKHKGQFRADGITPYINHPIRVAEIVKLYKKSKNIDAIVAAALLHDTLEDTYTSYRELEENFGEMVASMVMEVTTASYMPRLIGKGNYLKNKMLDMSPYALVIKLADRLDNVRDCATMPETRRNLMLKDTQNIIAFLEENRSLTTAHISLITELKKELEKIDENTL